MDVFIAVVVTLFVSLVAIYYFHNRMIDKLTERNNREIDASFMRGWDEGYASGHAQGRIDESRERIDRNLPK